MSQPPRPRPEGLDLVLDRFGTASPEMLESRRLLRRVDTKFMLPAHALIWVLANIANDYQVLRANGVTLAHYRTTYLDTPELRCFHDHRCGRRPRHKIRVREYIDRQLSFFEVKTKKSNDKTDKHRLVLGPDRDIAGNEQARRLVGLHTSIPFDELVPSMVVDFFRMTLLAVNDHERVTIDLGLDFHGAPNGSNLAEIAVVEVKQPSLARQTPIMRALHTHRVYPQSASKYCTTLVMARPDIPANHVRSALRAVERLQT